jgi:hypothetical protein
LRVIFCLVRPAEPAAYGVFSGWVGCEKLGVKRATERGSPRIPQGRSQPLRRGGPACVQGDAMGQTPQLEPPALLLQG